MAANEAELVKSQSHLLLVRLALFFSAYVFTIALPSPTDLAAKGTSSVFFQNSLQLVRSIAFV